MVAARVSFLEPPQGTPPARAASRQLPMQNHIDLPSFPRIVWRLAIPEERETPVRMPILEKEGKGLS